MLFRSCLYTVIHWKTAASVIQSGNWANTTVEAKVCTIQKTMIPLLSRENAGDYRNDLITELRGVRPTVFFCTLEVSAMESAYDDYPASSNAAYR